MICGYSRMWLSSAGLASLVSRSRGLLSARFKAGQRQVTAHVWSSLLETCCTSWKRGARTAAAGHQRRRAVVGAVMGASDKAPTRSSADAIRPVGRERPSAEDATRPMASETPPRRWAVSASSRERPPRPPTQPTDAVPDVLHAEPEPPTGSSPGPCEPSPSVRQPHAPRRVRPLLWRDTNL